MSSDIVTLAAFGMAIGRQIGLLLRAVARHEAGVSKREISRAFIDADAAEDQWDAADAAAREREDADEG